MRTHYCGLVDEALIGQSVTLCGWADVARNLGGVCFIDLRDHEGIVQVLVEPDNAAVFAIAEQVGYEDALQVTGTVRARHAVNERIRTGRVEVVASAIRIVNKARPLPFHAHENPGEDIRLKYRYLDLRQPRMQHMLRTRARLVRALRSWLDGQGFQDIETPVLTRATPEGARDFLVPARLHPGHFYALPQSPQLFKQLLMMAGFDRYYQIARCFRDEALRADRQLEFTQLDMELAWVDEAAVQSLVEAMIRHAFQEVLGVALPDPFPRMTWAEAMRRYGSDKPDLRIALELVDVADLVAGCGFRVFAEVAAAGGRIAALRLPGGARLSRKQIDGYAEHAGKHGARGLAWIRLGEDGQVTSPIAKFLGEDVLAALLQRSGCGKGDLVFFGAGDAAVVAAFMGAVRVRAGHDFQLVEDGWRPLWITDFPMFEWDAEAARHVALHHPFTAPAVDDEAQLRADPGAALSRAYDLVLNGNEIGGGSIRIHHRAMQLAVLELLGIDAAEAQEKFGFLIEALDYGAPPHGGIAFGIDRIAALMAGTESIRDVIAFPKTTGAQCPMTGAPSPLPDDQLAEANIAVRHRDPAPAAD